MPTFLITAPFPELWRGIEHEHLVLIDGHGLDGKPWLEGPNVEIAPVADILMEDIDKDGPIIDGLCDALLLDLAESLNRLHGLDESLRYWRMILAPWIRETVQFVYLRYKVLMWAFCTFPDARMTTRRGADGAAAPSDHFEATLRNHSPDMRHRVYTLLYPALRDGWALGHDCAPYEAQPTGHRDEKPNHCVRTRRLRIVGSNFSKVNRVAIHLSGPFVPTQSGAQRRSYAQPQEASLRQQLRFPRTDSLLAPLVTWLREEAIPKCLIEGWADLQVASGPALERPAILLTNAGLRRSFEIRILAATTQRQGLPVVVVQEGGGFGTKNPANLEKLDRELADVFVGWGRASAGPGTSLGIANRRGISNYTKRLGSILVLLGPTYEAPNDFGTLGRLPTSDYLDEISQLLTRLSPETRRLIRIRSKSTIDSQPRKRRLSQRSPLDRLDVVVDDNQAKIGDAVAGARLAIVTYDQTLAPILIGMGVPTVLFWSGRYCNYPPETEQIMAAMKSAGLWYESAVECAAAVESVVGSVESWWSSSDVVEARQLYCDAFARRIRAPGLRVGAVIRRELHASLSVNRRRGETSHSA